MTQPVDWGFERSLPSLAGATAWLNSPPLGTTELRGKVVLVEFCTYTCINWLRTLPYVRAWADRYKDQGLVVIGAHTPEFAFEKDIGNVRRSMEELKVNYPIAVDNNYAVWEAFSNQYWPAVYIADARGRIRYHHFGEGEYEESERAIQRLLTEAGASHVGTGATRVDARGIEAASDGPNLRSPENYVGYTRTENFASPGGVVPDQRHVYAPPTQLAQNHWALSGDWTMGPQALVLNKSNGKITYRFHARDLHLVMGAASSVKGVPFRVTMDGKSPADAHGLDVDGQGNGTVAQPRLYQLIRQSGTIVDRRFEIEFLNAGAEAFSFTFG